MCLSSTNGLDVAMQSTHLSLHFCSTKVLFTWSLL